VVAGLVTRLSEASAGASTSLQPGIVRSAGNPARRATTIAVQPSSRATGAARPAAGWRVVATAPVLAARRAAAVAAPSGGTVVATLAAPRLILAAPRPVAAAPNAQAVTSAEVATPTLTSSRTW
jgi:hypothetical protein